MITKKHFIAPFIIMSFLLFLLGFVTWINNVLVPFMEIKFRITPSQSQLVSAAFYGAYIVSIPIGRLVNKFGYKRSVIIGSVVTGIGCSIFVPALNIGYATILSGLFVTALGVALLQVVSNPYIIALGSKETSASRLNLAMAVNSAAATIAPLIGSLILSGSGTNMKINELAAKNMFIVLAATGVLTGVVLLFMPLPEINTISKTAIKTNSGKRVWKYPHLLLGFVAIGMYMGLEAGVGNFFVKYSSQNVGIDAAIAARFLSIYTASFFVGRLVGSIILRKVSATRLLLINSLVCVVLLTCFFCVKNSYISIWFLLSQGLFLSIMWSVLFDLSIKDIPGNQIDLASGIVCTGVVFTGFWQWIMGKYVDNTGTKMPDETIINPDYGLAYVFFYAFYIYIIFYALKGAKLRK